MKEELLSKLEEYGYRGRIVSTQHIHDLQLEIEEHHNQGLFDEDLYKEELSVFNFSPPKDLPKATSLIIVAVPQPPYRITFTWDGKQRSLIIPPTYLFGRKENKNIEELLANILDPLGYNVASATVPVKLLAVHSGLAEYGRNNICFIDGMGSFLRLAAIYSDFPCVNDNWQELRVMEMCEKCSVCLNKCPTGAINTDRFLLHAERCITFHNERQGDIPFPVWIDNSWHNCLVGCLHCQKFCPQNKNYLQSFEDGPSFSEEETDLLLQKHSIDEFPSVTAEKLKQFDMLGLLEVIPRNLNVFIK